LKTRQSGKKIGTDSKPYFTPRQGAPYPKSDDKAIIENQSDLYQLVNEEEIRAIKEYREFGGARESVHNYLVVQKSAVEESKESIPMWSRQGIGLQFDDQDDLRLRTEVRDSLSVPRASFQR
jgi:hypothetical protein